MELWLNKRETLIEKNDVAKFKLEISVQLHF